MFRRTTSRALVVLTALSLVIMSVGTAFADTITAEGDVLHSDTNLNISGSACDQLTWATKAIIGYGGGSHFADSAVVSVSSAPDSAAATAGITTAGNGTITMPSNWASAANNVARADQVHNMTVTLPADLADGTYKINMSATGAKAGGGTLTLPSSGNAFFNIIVDCAETTPPPPANVAPVVSANWIPDPVGCRVASTLEVSFTDSDSTSWTAAIDWDYQNATFDNADSLGAVTSPFSRSHTYNAPGTYTAAVQVTDNQGLVGSATDALTVNQTYSAIFLQPLDGSTPSRLIANTMKKGRVVPIKVTITDDCTLAPVNDPLAPPAISVVQANFTTTSTDAVETFSDAGQSAGELAKFRWTADSSVTGGGFWIFNLDSNGLQVGTCYKVYPEIGGIKTSNFAVLKPTK